MKAATVKQTTKKLNGGTIKSLKPILIPNVPPPEEAGPFGQITIDSNGKSTSTEIVNDGLVQFSVEFPIDKDICEIKLIATFKSSHLHKKAGELMLASQGPVADGSGGTIKIGG